MGFGIKELLVVLVIVILLFGTKKLKTMGTDLGGAIKGFKKSVADDEAQENEANKVDDKASDAIDAEVVEKEKV
ncbi:MAG: twin-arginine translocase TatA/TatE family subunit [Sinobacterium sp.]|nr:twin-arginine translocase TatA/TatE family subunit [Sinobacterium sp.]